MIGIDLVAGSALMPARRLVAVHHRQLDVHQDQIGRCSATAGERLLAVFRLDHS